MSAVSVLRSHISRADPRGIAPDDISIAAGNLKFPVLCRQIGGEDPLVRRNALEAIATGDLLDLAPDAVSAVEAGLIARLFALLADPEPRMRVWAMQAVKKCTKVRVGRNELLRDDIFPSLVRPDLLGDGESAVRRHILSTLVALTDSPLNASIVVDYGVVALLVARAGAEDDEGAKVLAIAAIDNCTRLPGNDGVVAAVQDGAIELCVSVLGEGSASERVMLGAARLLEKLTHWPQGKQRALDCFCLDSLCANLEHPHDEVKAACARALGNIAVPTRGKIDLATACDVPFVESLVTLLGLSQPADVQLSAVAAISTICAHPKLREALNAAGVCEALELCTTDASEPLLCSSARDAVAALQWQP